VAEEQQQHAVARELRGRVERHAPPVRAPDADSYDARFQPYTGLTTSSGQFKVKELITNSVMRWEYRPGSTLFVVWQHGRSGMRNNEPFRQRWNRDFTDLLGVHPENTFLVKVAYWLNR
jgi:hypothetical protein